MSTEQDDDTPNSEAPDGGTAEGNGIADQIRGWFAGRLPGGWVTGPGEIVVGREEITIVGTLPEPETGAPASAEKAAAAEGRIKRFREETRSKRIEIAREAEHRFRRKVAWGVRC